MTKHKQADLSRGQWRDLREGLADLMVEDILSTTDEEIIAEVKEDHGDVDKVVAETRAVADKAVAECRERLGLRDAEKTERQMKFDRNCAVLERCGSGRVVGRCWMPLREGSDFCHRHGDVSSIMRCYRDTGQLTDEKDFAEQIRSGEDDDRT